MANALKVQVVGADGNAALVNSSGAIEVDATITPIEPVATAAISSVNSSAVSGQLLAANASRRGLIAINTDANALYMKYGTTATTTGGGYSVIVPSGGYWEMPLPIYTGRIDGIWAADGAGLVELTEL